MQLASRNADAESYCERWQPSLESLFGQMMPYRVAAAGLWSAHASNWSRAARRPSRIQFSTTWLSGRRRQIGA